MPLSQRRTKTLYRACVRNFGTSYGSGYAVFVESPDLMCLRWSAGSTWSHSLGYRAVAGALLAAVQQPAAANARQPGDGILEIDPRLVSSRLVLVMLRTDRLQVVLCHFQRL